MNQYIEEKKYQAEIRKDQINSWKQYCNTSPSKPWHEAISVPEEEQEIQKL